MPRNFLYRNCVLAAGLLLLALDAFPDRWRDWVRTHDAAELEAGFLAAVAAWCHALFVAEGFASPLRGLSLFLGLLLAVRLLSRRKPETLPVLSKGLFAALAGATALAALAFARLEPQHFLICGLLLLLPAAGKSWGLRGVLPRRFTAAFFLGVLFCAFWATIPPSAFRFPADLSHLPPNVLTFYENHLDSFALGPALRLQAHRPFFGIQPLYGWGAPLLMVALNRVLGWPVDIGTFLRIGFALKYVFVSCAVIGLSLFGGRRLLPALLFSLWVLSWNNSASPVLEPSHSAARYVGVPLFFLVLWSVRRKSFPVLLAAAAPALWLCALINQETGLALFAAALVYAWFRWRGDGLPARLKRTLALVAAASPAALVCRSELAAMSSSGFGGSAFVSSPAPFAVVLTALIVWADVAASPEARSPKNAYRAAAAAFLLIWFAYYVNNPFPTDLSIYLYVFGFFALDILRAASFRAKSAPRRIAPLMLVAVAAPLLTGALTDASRDLLWEFRHPQAIFHPSSPDRVASGVRISADFAAQLRDARASWMRYSRPGEPCLMLHSHPIFLTEATCVSSLPFSDAFQTLTLANDRRELDAIRSSRAKDLFIEPAEDLTDDERRRAYARLRAEIAGDYRLRASPSHLEVWERRPL